MASSGDDLRARLRSLEADLAASPPRISAYHDLPFAIFRYDPTDEYVVRQEAHLLATRLGSSRRVRFISLARLLWHSIEATEGLARIIEDETESGKGGFERAQRTVSTLLSDTEFAPLPKAVSSAMSGLDPKGSVAFLVRAAALAPSIYHVSKLLDELQGLTRVPAILFYPGSLNADSNTGLRFMAMPDREAYGNYRVKIY